MRSLRFGVLVLAWLSLHGCSRSATDGPPASVAPPKAPPAGPVIVDLPSAAGGSRAQSLTNGGVPSKESTALPAVETAALRCTTAQVVVAGQCRAPGTLVLEAPLGRGKGQIAIHRGEDRGPMSLAVRDNGDIWILNQENKQLQPFRAGAPLEAVPLDLATYQDVAFLDSERLVVMDRLVAARLTIIDTQGRVLEKIPLAGPGLEEPSTAGILLSRSDGVWLTRRRRSIRVLDAVGKADALRPQIEGDPSFDGKYTLHAHPHGRELELIKRERATGAIAATAKHVFAREVSMHSEVQSDAAGNLYLSTIHFGSEAPPSGLFVVFNSALELLRSTPMTREVNDLGVESFRDTAVTGAGEAYVLRVAEEGVRVRQY